jgi:hypothetical protein
VREAHYTSTFDPICSAKSNLFGKKTNLCVWFKQALNSPLTTADYVDLETH